MFEPPIVQIYKYDELNQLKALHRRLLHVGIQNYPPKQTTACNEKRQLPLTPPAVRKLALRVPRLTAFPGWLMQEVLLLKLLLYNEICARTSRGLAEESLAMAPRD